MHKIKYYRLIGSSDPKIIGVNNGICQGNIIWNKFKSENSKAIISNYFSIEKYGRNLDKIEPINFEFEYVEAYKGAKMTDFFMFSPAMYGIYFFITTKAKDILQKFKLPLHAYIPVTISHKDVKYKYWALYTPNRYRESSFAIQKCIFNVGGIINKELLKFSSLEEYRSKKEYFNAERIVYNNTIDLTLDLLLSLFIGNGYLISEGLKEAIDGSGLTGLNIYEPKYPEVHFE